MLSANSLQVGLEPFPGFRLQRLRGAGCFGEVWEAATADGQVCALKFMPTAEGHAAVQEIRTIQMIRALQHPNVLPADQVWSQAGYLVVRMELADASLLDLFELHLAECGAPLPPQEVCFLLSQAADGLDFLNARRHLVGGQVVAVQHCDVKPSNLLLFGDAVKLADFGLAAPVHARLQAHGRVGSPDYAAPEVFHGQLSNSSDQYSLAVTYCQLRGGRLPFPTVNSFQASWPQVRPPVDLSMLAAPERPIIARALGRVPHERWPSCARLMAELRDAVGAHRLHGKRTVMDPPGRPAARAARTDQHCLAQTTTHC
ncbi:MAG: serine/threonine protein kinase [Gemmataceae bacterium]|nr:serine/threonine protein kinase [Gemmataceae bacterium]